MVGVNDAKFWVAFEQPEEVRVSALGMEGARDVQFCIALNQQSINLSSVLRMGEVSDAGTSNVPRWREVLKAYVFITAESTGARPKAAQTLQKEFQAFIIRSVNRTAVGLRSVPAISKGLATATLTGQVSALVLRG